MSAEQKSAVAVSFLEPYIKKAEPIIDSAIKVVELASPFLHQAYVKGEQFWTAIQPYHPQDMLPMFVGLFMIFFGGEFTMLIATVEAFRMCGWDTTKRSWDKLMGQVVKIRSSSVEDDKVDADGDGKSDAVELLEQKRYTEYARRKALVYLRTADPDVLTEAVGGLTSGWLAVVATLRMQFAKAITLGSTIGGILYDLLSKYLEPHVLPLVPAEYRKWVDPTLKYSCKTLGVSFAWFIQRIISAFHSAIRGGQIFTGGFLSYASKYGVLASYLDKDGDGKPDITPSSKVFLAVSLGMAALGFITQLSFGFGLPFPLNILLLPIRIVEWFLIYFVAIDE